MVFAVFVVGTLLGMVWGGNYFSAVQMFGTQGYEAVGPLVGYVLAAGVGAMWGKMKSAKRIPASVLAMPVAALMFFSLLIAQIAGQSEYLLFLAFFPMLAVFGMGAEEKDEQQFVGFLSLALIVIMMLVS